MIVNKYSKGGGGSGSTVNWNQQLSAGTQIARITIDGTPQNVYAPEGGSYVAGTGISISSNTISVSGYPIILNYSDISANTEQCIEIFTHPWDYAIYYDLGSAYLLCPYKHKKNTNVLFETTECKNNTTTTFRLQFKNTGQVSTFQYVTNGFSSVGSGLNYVNGVLSVADKRIFLTGKTQEQIAQIYSAISGNPSNYTIIYSDLYFQNHILEYKFNQMSGTSLVYYTAEGVFPNDYTSVLNSYVIIKDTGEIETLYGYNQSIPNWTELKMVVNGTTGEISINGGVGRIMQAFSDLRYVNQFSQLFPLRYTDTTDNSEACGSLFYIKKINNGNSYKFAGMIPIGNTIYDGVWTVSWEGVTVVSWSARS